jgi:hypothetical protein
VAIPLIVVEKNLQEALQNYCYNNNLGFLSNNTPAEVNTCIKNLKNTKNPFELKEIMQNYIIQYPYDLFSKCLLKNFGAFNDLPEVTSLNLRFDGCEEYREGFNLIS